MSKKPETIEEWQAKSLEFISLLIECREALPAITSAAAKMYQVSIN